MYKTIFSILLLLTSPGAFCSADIIIGAGTHFGQNKTDKDAALDWIHSSGFNSLRDEIYWHDVEKEKGIFTLTGKAKNSALVISDMANKGLHPLVVLDYGNQFYDEGGQPYSRSGKEAFGRYCRWIASELPKTVRYFEIWNEWNHGMGARSELHKGSPSDYVELAEQCSKGIRSVNPGATILGGAVTNDWGEWPWLSQSINLGLLKHVDGVSIHLYNFLLKMEKGGEDFFIKRIDTLSKIIEKSTDKNNVGIYITEVGWPNHIGTGSVDTNTAADAALRFLLRANERPDVAGIWFYELIDSGENPVDKEHHFGFLDFHKNEKPIGCALRNVNSLIKAKRPIKSQTVGQLRIQTYQTTNVNEYLTAIWTNSWETTATASIKAAGNYSVISLGCNNTQSSKKSSKIILNNQPIFLKNSSPIEVHHVE